MTLRLGGDGAITGCTSLKEPTISISGLTMTTPIEAIPGTAAAPSYTFSGDTDNGLYYAGTNSIGLATAGTNAILIDSSGKVGIGTSLPSTKLEVIGDVKVVNTGIAYLQPNTVTAFQAYESSGPVKISLNNNGSATFAGNIGIGTTSLTHQLTVHNASPTGGTIEANRFSARDNYGSASGLGNGIFSPASNTLAFATNSAERMRIFSDGGVNIKKYLEFRNQGDTTQAGYLGNAADLVISGSANDFALRAEVNLLFSTSGSTERMRIDSSGNVGIGTTATGSAKGTLLFNGQVENGSIIQSSWNGNNASYIIFRNYLSNTVGQIFCTTTSTTYSTSSDYRLKENVIDISDGITRVKQLLPKRFNFIADDTTTVDGFIAHEAQTVVPEAVTGEKDGNEIQGIDQSKLVPLLTAALQEAIAKIETLETKVAALEAGIA